MSEADSRSGSTSPPSERDVSALADVKAAIDAYEDAVRVGHRAAIERMALASAIALLAGTTPSDRARITRALRSR
jgi:hypothetical protein